MNFNVPTFWLCLNRAAVASITFILLATGAFTTAVAAATNYTQQARLAPADAIPNQNLSSNLEISGDTAVARGADYSNVSVLQMDPGCACPKIVMSGGAVPDTSFARFIVQ